LHKTKARLGLGPTQPLRGATPSALAATTSKRKVTPPANLRPHPGFGTGGRPHHCSQVEARSRGDGGNREGDSQEGGSDCPGVQQGRSAIPAEWKRQLSRLSDYTQLLPGNVRFGSLADIVQPPRHVCFTSDSGHLSACAAGRI